jgi:hypothetical protein
MCDSDSDRKYNELIEKREILEKIELLENQIEFLKNKIKKSNEHLKVIYKVSDMFEKVYWAVVPYVEPDKIDDFLEDIKNGKYRTGKYNL